MNIVQFYKKLGPGLITGASDDDPSGIATYSQAGAQFGFMTLWMAFFTFPLMVAIQEMCGRIGLVTGEGLAHILLKHYPKWLFYLMIMLTLPALILNIAADIASMGAVAHMLVPFIHSSIFCIFITVILAIVIIFLNYTQIVKFLKYFCFSLLFYLLIPFVINIPWLTVFKAAFIPEIHLNKKFLNIMVAILGTTISPYMFFWQATMASEGRKQRDQNLKQCIKDLKMDVSIGMFFSNVVMFFIILTTGAVLFSYNVHEVNTVEDAAKALEPLAGSAAYLLFALGILGTGFLTIPVLCGCFSYILATPLHIRNGLNLPFGKAKIFYLIILSSLIIALIINFLGLSPIQALIWTAVLYGLTAPFIIGFILLISNNKAIMKGYTNSVLSNVIGGCGFILMLISAGLLIYYLL